MTPRDTQAGFTLIEALVAMAVLSLGAVSLLTATEGHAARITEVTDRTAARWVADYALTATRLGVPPDGSIAILGRDFPVTVTEEPLTGADLLSLDVTVMAPGDRSDLILYRATGYRVAGVGGQGNE